MCGIVRGVDGKTSHFQLSIDDSSGAVAKIYFFRNEFGEDTVFDFTIGMTLVVQGKISDFRDERTLIATKYWILRHPNEEVLYRTLLNIQ